MFRWGDWSPIAWKSVEQSTARINVWEGAVRSGKTVASIYRWAEFVRRIPPGYKKIRLSRLQGSANATEEIQLPTGIEAGSIETAGAPAARSPAAPAAAGAASGTDRGKPLGFGNPPSRTRFPNARFGRFEIEVTRNRALDQVAEQGVVQRFPPSGYIFAISPFGCQTLLERGMPSSGDGSPRSDIVRPYRRTSTEDHNRKQ